MHGENVVLIELSVIPLGTGTHLSDEIAEILRLVADSGLPYQLTPAGTCIEGEWDEVMQLVRRCHARAREHSPHVITTVKIEDQQGATNQLRRNVAAVQQEAGRPGERIP